MGAAPRKTKQRRQKTYKLHPFAILLLNLLHKFFVKGEKTKHEAFDFVYLLFLSFLTCITQKLYHVCEYYTYQRTALLPGIFLFWFGVVYELRLASYGHKTVPQCARCSRSGTSVASGYVFRVWHVYRVAGLFRLPKLLVFSFSKLQKWKLSAQSWSIRVGWFVLYTSEQKQNGWSRIFP